MNKSDLVESNFQQDLIIINNEIRGFMASLYKFFVSRIESRDCELILEQMSDVILGVKILLYKIELRRHAVSLSFPEFSNSDICVGVTDPNSSSFMAMDTDPGRTRRNTNSNRTSYTFNESFDRTYDMAGEAVGGTTLNMTAKPAVLFECNKTQAEIQKDIDLGGSLNDGTGSMCNFRRE